MPKQKLILVNSSGNVFSLNTENRYFKELVGNVDGLKFKRASAVESSCWAIGHDQQVYIFVFSTDVPIRVAETTFENQRWSPWSGFSNNNLLPSDRKNWSNERGNKNISQSDFPLPSQYWEWEGDWFIDENFKGEITDRGGWQYASDFPRKYTPEPKTLSMVRRRKWLRFRRFVATGKWAKIASDVCADEDGSFIDVAVGGFELPGQPPGFLSVWTLTVDGKVFVRNNVCAECPEGISWKLICTDTIGVVNISVGPTGLVWAVTYDGLVIVRLGINRENVYGTGWCQIPYPTGKTRMMQVAVGRFAVWALSREGQVWFRKGIDGDKAWFNEEASVGNCWVEMVGLLCHISITPNDQVIGIGLNDRKPCFRTGVSASDLGGKTWQVLSLQENITGLGYHGSSGSHSIDDYDDSSESNFHGSVSLRGTPVSMTSITEHTTESNDNSSMPMCSMMSSKPVTNIGKVGNNLIDKVEKDVLTTKIINQMDYNIDRNILKCDDTRNTTLKTDFQNIVDRPSDSNSQSVHIKDNCDSNSQSLHIKDNCDNNTVQIDVGIKDNCDNNAVQDDVGIKDNCDNNTVQDVGIKDNCDNNAVQDVGIKDNCDNNTVQVDVGIKDNCDNNALKDVEVKDNYGNNTLQDNFGIKDNYDNNTVRDDIDVQDNCDESGEDVYIRQDSLNSDSDQIINFVTDMDEEDIQVESTVVSHTISDGHKSELVTETVEKATLTEQDIDVFRQDDDDIIAFMDNNPYTCDSTDTTPIVDIEVTDMFMLTPAMPRYFWVWFSAMGCIIEDTASIKWLQTRKDSDVSIDSSNIRKMISSNLRSIILDKICKRNNEETQQFQYIEHAVEKTSWMKKSAMKWFRYGYRARFEDVMVELEQGIQQGDEGAITIHYCPRGNPVITQINLSDLICVKKLADPNLQTVFQIHTPDTTSKCRPYLLMTSSEAEADDWLSTILTANNKDWKVKQTVAIGSIWSSTLRGDVFIHQPLKIYCKSYEMLWCQQGGHLKRIETCSSGITWAIGFDHTPWLYNGGFGGGIFRATSGMSKDCNQQSDTRTIYTYENQKWYPVIGYTNKGFLTDSYEWSDSTGRQERNKESIKLPTSGWQWSCDWSVDFNAPGKVDQEGWQYSRNFNKPFHPQPGLRDRVRRRRWYRKCKLLTVGPWYRAGPTTIKDISLQLDPVSSADQQLVVWAIASNGNVLCRLGVTTSNHQGDSWIDIPTDLSFTSVSIGGSNRAWGVAIDGSVWYRPGVTSDNPTGKCWLQVIPTPPAGSTLNYVSAGQTSIWALDTKDILWFREEITPTFPEGTRWNYVCNKVKHVSVGFEDQVWIVSAANFGKNKHGSGVVYKRLGITSDRPVGTGWEMVIGDGWQYVSIRGFTNNKIEM